VNDREHEVLTALRDAKGIAPAWKGWLTPMFCGGRDASHHSRTLALLCKRGLVERRRRNTLANELGSRRGSYVYRITAAGRLALKADKS